MSITEELRKWMREHYVLVGGMTDLIAIADRIDAEHEAMLADARKTVYQGYVELPKDADGVSIHVGDTVCRTDPPKVPSTVAYMTLFEDGDWQVHMDERANVHAAYQPSLLCHYHEPTVDELLDQLEGLRGNGSDYEDVVTRASEIAEKLRELLKEDV